MSSEQRQKKTCTSDLSHITLPKTVEGVAGEDDAGRRTGEAVGGPDARGQLGAATVLGRELGVGVVTLHLRGRRPNAACGRRSQRAWTRTRFSRHWWSIALRRSESRRRLVGYMGKRRVLDGFFSVRSLRFCPRRSRKRRAKLRMYVDRDKVSALAIARLRAMELLGRARPTPFARGK